MKKMLQKVIPDPQKFFPAGCSWQRELDWYAAGLTCSIIFGFLLYSSRYSAALDSLYQDTETARVFRPGAVMDDFSVLTESCMMGFVLLMAATVPWAVAHYNYHYKGSKSIYLMKRLPDQRDLWRRCLAAPIAAAVFTAITALLFILLLFGIYCIAVPEEVFNPGQWHRFWRNLL